MKREIIIILGMMLCLSVAAQRDVQRDAKKIEKESRALARQLEKDGWRLDGDSRTMTEVLTTHYTTMANGKVEQVEGNASRCRNLNICRQVARNNATAIRMAMMEGKIEAEIENKITNIQTGKADEAVTTAEFRAEYRQKKMQQIKDGLRESYSIVKDNGDGTMDYKIVFIINAESEQ